MRVFLVFIALFVTLASGISLLTFGSGAPLVTILLFQLMIMPLALDASEVIVACCVQPEDLPALDSAPQGATVAVLFLLCDDLVPSALAALGNQTVQADYFILDDSATYTIGNSFNQEIHVVRRGCRHGHKAGNLNHWLRLFGKRYQYFVVLDSDSILPEDFLDRMLRYAEHRVNRRVAIFNSLTECWNTRSAFAADLSALGPLNNWIRLRVANRYATVLSQGHNNLHRTEAVLAAGGFDERFVAEGIALTLTLFKHGCFSKVVNVVSYEGAPENLSSHTKRLLRWARQNIEIQRANWTQVPFDAKFQMFRLLATYGSAWMIALWSLLLAWSGNTYVSQIRLDQIMHSGFFSSWMVAMALPVLSVIVRIPLLVRVGVSVKSYVRNLWLIQALVSATMLPLCCAQFNAIVTNTVTFTVTPKAVRSETLGQILAANWHVLLFSAVLLVGLAQAPIKLLFYAPYLLALLGAPFVIYRVSRVNS